MTKRKGKFYYKNEKNVMKFLGLETVPGSGSGWVHKEDGESETVMVQLKSTDASSYRLDMLDMKKLEYHAAVSNKVPIFLVEFLQQDKLYAIIEVNNIEDLSEAFKLQKKPDNIKLVKEEEPVVISRTIKSSKKSRETFFKEKEKQYGKRK